MGKSLPSLSRILQEISRAPSSSSFHNPNNPKRPKPILKQFAPKQTGPKQVERGVELGKSKSKMEEKSPQSRYKLSMVVNDCVKRWFQDTLKEAKGGDCSMQVLVGQMYYSGYGVPRDPQKGRVWISKASRNRSSVWKISEKQPGYNASDSDSDEAKDALK